MGLTKFLFWSFIISISIYGVSSFAGIDHPEKIGIGTWEYNSTDAALRKVEEFGFKWYYDWRTTPLWSPSTTAVRTVPFIPMIWDEAHVNESVPRTTGILLGFNEPDHPGQANMSVDQAISLWPKLQATGLRLGSPAPTFTQALGSASWLGRFMSQAQSKGYRVDFICVHYYNANKDVNAFKAFLESVYTAYQRPIWVTEWALVDWNNPGRYSLEENAIFAQQALEMLDDLPYVERHAWFAAYNSGEGLHTELFDKNNNPTVIGNVFYQALHSAVAPEPTPTPAPSPTPTNMVLNPGFESGVTNWTDWGNSAVVQSNAASGSYSLRTGTGAGGRGQRVSGISPSKSYRFSVKAKLGASGDMGYVGITFRNSSGGIVKQFASTVTTATYQTFTLDIVTPSSFSYVEVWSYKNAGSNYLYVDDFSLFPR